MMDSGTDLLHQPVSAWLRVIGRLRPGASAAAMSPRLTGVLRQWMQYESHYPANWMPDIMRSLNKQVINVVPAGSGVAEMKEGYGRSLQILFAVCGLVLLIACANVANLLLVRFVSRRPQTALRLAVGATQTQIVTQALVESVLLALAGGLAGLLVAMATSKLLLALAFSAARFIPISITPSWPVLGFACGVSLLTGIIFGVGPAWLATRTNPVEALRGHARSAGGHSSLANRVLVIVQATLSIVLVAGATMLARSLDNLEHQDLGYKVHGRVLVSLNRAPSDYTLPKLTALYRRIEQRLNQLPGVRGSGLALYNPLTDNWGELVMVAGHPPGKMNGESGSSWDRVSSAYLRNFGISILRGRDFTESDNENAAPVAIVNQAFVKRFFGKD
jgi:predicted permease